MNVPQFTVMTIAAANSSQARRRPSRRTHAKPLVNASTATRKTSDQTIRWARISTGAAGSSNGQYSGNSPQST